MTENTETKGINIGTIALILAGILAIGAIGIQAYRSMNPQSEESSTIAETVATSS